MATRKQKFYLAPLRGVTDSVFRNVYEKHFGKFDYMLAPFIPTIRGNRVKDYHIRDILPDNGCNDTKRLIPQIIGRDAEGFLLLSNKFAELGFPSVNWNLGCPAPLITRKKRGSGLLPHKDIIERFLDEVIPKLPIPLSIKTRLGLDSKDDLETLIPIFNNYPLTELIIHPRTGSQLYGGTVDIDKFETCLNKSTHTVVYNGDIISVDNLKYLTGRFPNVNNWMIGRGIVRNPNLLKELRNENTSTQSIYDFLNDLISADPNNPSNPNDPNDPNHSHTTKILGRMKEIWRYLGAGIDESGELTQKIMHCDRYWNIKIF
jgi:tRNA-dihydrouridine synthase